MVFTWRLFLVITIVLSLWTGITEFKTDRGKFCLGMAIFIIIGWGYLLYQEGSLDYIIGLFQSFGQ